MTLPSPPASRRPGAVIAILGLAFILAMTLTPQPQNVEQVARTPLWCLRCGDLSGMDILLNVILFVPLGFGLRLAGLPRRRVLLAAFATTFLVELTQYFLIVGRDATLSDILTNTTGGFVGMVLAERFPVLLWPGPRTAGLLAAAWGAGWLGVQLVTAWGDGVTLPDRPYWGQLAPELGQFDRFRGTIVGGKVAGEPMPSARLPDSRTVRERLLRGAGLEARAVSGAPTTRLAPIVSVFDQDQHEITLLGQWGTDLVFRIHTRAWSLGLRGPALRVSRALPADSGRPFAVSGRLAGGCLVASADTGTGPQARSLALSPSFGWSLVLPFENYAFGGGVRLLTALWLGGLLLPLGYWTARGLSGAVSGPLVLGLVIAAGLAGAAALFRLPAVHWSEWLAATSGAGAGWLLGRRGR